MHSARQRHPKRRSLRETEPARTEVSLNPFAVVNRIRIPKAPWVRDPQPATIARRRDEETAIARREALNSVASADRGDEPPADEQEES